MIQLVYLLSCFSLALGASQLEIKALLDLYNSCNGENWYNSNNWSPTGEGDPCGPYPWAGVSCDGNPQYVNIVKLYHNNLVGQIPDSIVDLSSLTVLDLSYNALSGTVPEGMYSMATLNQLQLNLNNLSGTISSSIGNLQALTILSLGQNSFHGIIPESLYTIRTLRQIEFTGNQLSGSISNSINNLQTGSNKLSGTIPAGFGSLPSLNSLQFTTNILTAIPSSLCSVYSLTGLWLDNNRVAGGGLTGIIPPCIGNLTSLIYLFLSGNKLTGGVPYELSSLTNLQQLFLGDNSLGGTIPSQLGQIGINLTHLDVSQSSMTGAIPAELGNLTGLQYLNLATNQLTGTIPNSLENLVNLQQLLLQATYGSSNTLSGTVPAGIFSLQQLNLLMLANNKFSGSLPASFSLTNLQQLDLTGTQLGGSIQAIFGNPQLTLLFLANNKLEGTLELMPNLPLLTQLTLNNNKLSGFVPSYFTNTTFGNPPKSVLANNPFLCPLPPWAHADTGAVCIDWKITVLSPPYADTIYNTAVSVNGSDFQNLTGLMCNFGDINATATYITSTQLLCTAPATQNVSRELNFTLSYGDAPFGLEAIPTFVYLGVPIIDSIAPNSGREQGSVMVTVTGSQFYNSLQWNLVSCWFGTAFVLAAFSSSEVVCVTPPNTPGDVSISVSIDGNITIGNDDVMFTYYEYCGGLPEACMGNGVCNTVVSPPVCLCNTNYVGMVCGECEDSYFGPQCLACPPCGLNGTCNSTITGDGLCVCQPGFYGGSCRACPQCVHGKCSDGRRGDGKCTCSLVWGGELCDSRWKMYAMGGLPAVVIVVVVVVVLVRIQRSKREYKRLPRLPKSEDPSIS